MSASDPRDVLGDLPPELRPHAERRGRARVRVARPAAFVTAGLRSAAVTRDLSPEGALLEFADPPPLSATGGVVDLDLGEHGRHRYAAEVLRTGRDPRGHVTMAARLQAHDPHGDDALRRAIDEDPPAAV